jgi:hypothetical protein
VAETFVLEESLVGAGAYVLSIYAGVGDRRWSQALPLLSLIAKLADCVWQWQIAGGEGERCKRCGTMR